MLFCCQENNILGGIIAAVGVAERARQHGFTASELQRAKSLKLNHDERKYRERDDRRNSKYVSAITANFLNGEPLISIDDQLELTRRFDREVTLEEVNNAVRELVTDKNQVAIMYAPPSNCRMLLILSRRLPNTLLINCRSQEVLLVRRLSSMVSLSGRSRTV